jgi:hypothetical protein
MELLRELASLMQKIRYVLGGTVHDVNRDPKQRFSVWAFLIPIRLIRPINLINYLA